MYQKLNGLSVKRRGGGGGMTPKNNCKDEKNKPEKKALNTLSKKQLHQHCLHNNNDWQRVRELLGLDQLHHFFHS